MLCEKLSITLGNPSETAVREEANAYEKWLHVATLEEEFLKQEAERFFSDFLNHSPGNYQEVSEVELHELLQFICSLLN